LIIFIVCIRFKTGIITSLSFISVLYFTEVCSSCNAQKLTFFVHVQALHFLVHRVSLSSIPIAQISIIKNLFILYIYEPIFEIHIDLADALPFDIETFVDYFVPNIANVL